MESNSNEKVWFLGRSYYEYLKMFNLTGKQLRHKSVLDCAAGASSFTPTLSKKGFNSTAVDVCYGVDPQVISERCENDFNTLIDFHSKLANKTDWDFFKDSEDMIKYRTEVYKEFIDDYSTNYEKYVKAKLPTLPFPDNNFSLVLCSHLLFLYDDRLNYDFHIKSVNEMLRVAEEVRIFPIVRLRGKGERSAFVNQLIDDLSPDVNIEILKVDYEFRQGANEMIKITK